MNVLRRHSAKHKHQLWYRGAVRCFRELFKKVEAGRLETWAQLHTEDRITGALIDRITDKKFQEELNDCIEAARARVNVTWITDRHEQSTGADIGAIINIDGPDIHEEKGILLQAKRFHERKQIFPDVKRKQAEKMLGITAASFYIFYHPKGFWVTSASNIHSVFPSGKDSMGLSLRHLRAIPQLRFSNFMVNYFMKTFVGDARPDIVNRIRTGELAKWSLKMVVKVSPRQE